MTTKSLPMNQINVTGKILSVEEKLTSQGTPFFMVDLETFSGPNLRFQAWNNAYSFIKKNRLDHIQDKSINNTYIEAKGYMHVYKMPAKYDRVNEYTTFKMTDINFPSSKICLEGTISDIYIEPNDGSIKDGHKIIKMDNQVSFRFYPNIDVFYEGEISKARPIDCVMDTKKYFEIIDKKIDLTKNKYIIVGDVDNSNKKLTRITVDNIIPLVVEV